MKSAIIVDSSATIKEELENHPDIYQVYLTINFSDGEIFRDSSDKTKTKKFMKC